MKITVENQVNSEIEIVIKGDITSNEVKNLIDFLGNIDNSKHSKILICKKQEKEYVIPITDIEYFQSMDNATTAISKNNEYKTKLKLFEIESNYTSYGFIRISKSIILNCNYIKYLELEFSGNYTVVTKNNRSMTISRRYVGKVKKYIKEEM